MSWYHRAVAAYVTIYVQPGCGHCERRRDQLVARGLIFDEVDVRASPEVVPELLKLTKGRRIVPVVVEGTRISVASDGGSEF